MKSYKRKKSTAWMLVLVMVLSLMTGVGVLPKEVAKADGAWSWESQEDHNEEWDMFLSESDGTKGYKEAERVFAYSDENYYRGEVNAKTGNDIVFYIHYYSSNGNNLDQIRPWFAKAHYDGSIGQWGQWVKEDATLSSNVVFGEKEEASGHNEEEGTCSTYHKVQKVTIKPGSVVESFTIGLYEYYDEEDTNRITGSTRLAEVIVRKPDALWIPDGGNINSLDKTETGHAKKVGEELYQLPGNGASKGYTYLGKAYYYCANVLYPNVDYDTVIRQNRNDFSTTPKGWTVRGIYDENGNPLGSHIFYQYYLVDKDGGIKTDDDATKSHPVQYLVYDEFPEDTSKGNNVDANTTGKSGKFSEKFGIGKGFVNSCPWTDLKGDGTEIISPGETYASVTRTFGKESSPFKLYDIWGFYGKVTVNGDILSCVTLDRESSSEEKDGGRWFVCRDVFELEDNLQDEAYEWQNNLIKDSEKVHEGISTTYKALYEKKYINHEELTEEEKDIIKGAQFIGGEIEDPDKLKFDQASVDDSILTVKGGDVGFIDLHDNWKGNVVMGAGCTVGGLGIYHNRDALFSPSEATVDWYSSVVGNGGAIITEGKIDKNIIHPVIEDEEQGGPGVGSSIYGIDIDNPDPDKFNSYISIPNQQRDGEDVESTSAGVKTYGGGGKVDALQVDITYPGEGGVHPMIRKKNDSANEPWRKGSSWWNAISSFMHVSHATIMDIALVQYNDHLVEPANEVNLYVDGIDENNYGGTVALYHVTDDGRVEKVSSGSASGVISGATDSFSTYFVAEDTQVPDGIDAEIAALAQAQYESDIPEQLSGGGYVGPGGSGGGGSGGGSGDKTPASPTPVKEVTDNEKDADGNDVTTTTKTYEDGSKQITETVKDPNTGEVLETTETSVKTDETTGDKTTESKTVTKDGTETESKLVEKKDGSTSETVKVTQPSGATSERKETKETDGSSEVIVTDTKANGDYTSDTITTKVVPSADGSGTQTKTVIEREEKKGKTETTAKYTVSDPKKKTLVLTSFTTNAKGTTISIGSGIEADGVSYKITAIAPKAFKGNKKVKKFNSGNSVTKLGDQMLMKAKNLKKVVLGKNVKELGAKLFNKASSLKNILINSGKITKVGARAFDGISKDAVIKIDASVKAFRKIKKLIVGSGGVPKGVKFKRI